MAKPFRDRIDGGRHLAALLIDLRDRDDVCVLGLPRGGVPVAAEVAPAIDAPLDVLLVRKLGVPHQPELAMGAVASGDRLLLDHDLIAHMGVTDAEVDTVIARERELLHQREQLYRGNRPAPNLQDKVVVLVDDGLATGSTMRVAIQAVRLQHPEQIIVAVPVGPAETIAAIATEVDRIECVRIPTWFRAVGQWYRDFRPTTDDEVIEALRSCESV